jgi:hypothetical protein
VRWRWTATSQEMVQSSSPFPPSVSALSINGIAQTGLHTSNKLLKNTRNTYTERWSDHVQKINY